MVSGLAFTFGTSLPSMVALGVPLVPLLVVKVLLKVHFNGPVTHIALKK